jgi:hypothetical protein
MTHAAPGSGSPVDNPNFLPADQPYEPNQGTGDAERPQEEVDAEQETLLGTGDGEEPAEEKKPRAKKAKGAKGSKKKSGK